MHIGDLPLYTADSMTPDTSKQRLAVALWSHILGMFTATCNCLLAVINVVCDEHTHEGTSMNDSDKKILDKMDYNVFATAFKVEHFRIKVRISGLRLSKIVKPYAYNICYLSDLITLGF